jgi:hypothetical protein
MYEFLAGYAIGRSESENETSYEDSGNIGLYNLFIIFAIIGALIISNFYHKEIVSIFLNVSNKVTGNSLIYDIIFNNQSFNHLQRAFAPFHSYMIGLFVLLALFFLLLNSLKIFFTFLIDGYFTISSLLYTILVPSILILASYYTIMEVIL